MSAKRHPESQLAQMGFGFMGGGLGGVYGRSSGHSTNIGKRHLRSEEDYFEQEDEVKMQEDLEYQPAPGSPSYVKKDENHSDSDSDDPLEAFMSGIDKEVKDLSEKDRRRAQGKDAEKDKNVRDDIEGEDEQESYFRYMEENPTAGLVADDDDIIDYDEDGNPIFVNKKVIVPLDPIDHSEIEYEPFNKNFYEEHEDIAKLTPQQVQTLLDKLGLKVSGLMPIKPVSSFAHFKFDELLTKAIRKAGYTQPTPIQSQAIPIALSGRDIIGIAKTGSGKTAAYLWPMIVHILDQRELQPGEGPVGLVCAPTRELAQQIYNEAKKFGKAHNIRVVCAYGGGSLYEQCKACEEGAEIIVATPGRLIDLIKKKATNFRRVTFVVFDEADRMFDMGFEPQVRSIASNVRPDRQTLMFSATFRKRVERVARDILSDPLRVIQGELGEANQDVTQIVKVLPVGGAKWQWLVSRLVEFTSTGSVLIFVTKKANSDELANNLKLNDFKVALMHGDMNQVERNEVINAFRKKEYPILVATDVAARGLDIPHIKTVVNFDVARDIDTHIHRVGRTGRAGEKGTAYTLITNKDKEFGGHLVRHLEAANQTVPGELMELAQQNPWFKKSRFKQESARKPNIGGKGLGYKDKGGQRGEASTSSMPLGQGPQGDRVASMKAAFMQQFKTNFVVASAEGGGRSTMQFSSPRVDDDTPPAPKPAASQVPGLKGILYSSSANRSSGAAIPPPTASVGGAGSSYTSSSHMPPPASSSGPPAYMKGFVSASSSSQAAPLSRTSEEPTEKKRKKSRWE